MKNAFRPASVRRRVKPHHKEALKRIAILGGAQGYTSLSTRELGRDLSVSQQAASQRILELIELGLVSRDLATRRQRVRLTAKGLDVLRREYADLQRIFEIRETLTIAGTVASGLGEGAFYMRQRGYKEQFHRKLYFEPYEGTLNVRVQGDDLSKLQILHGERGIVIDEFRAVGRTFGGAKCFLATLRDVECAVIMPLRSHHTDVVEVISEQYLRGVLSLKDEDGIDLVVTL